MGPMFVEFFVIASKDMRLRPEVVKRMASERRASPLKNFFPIEWAYPVFSLF